MARRRQQQRERIPLRLPDGREVELLRVVDPRARHLRLLVSVNGPRLTVPLATSQARAQQFLLQHLDWLADQLADDPNAATDVAPPVPGEPGHVLLRGQRLQLDWQRARWLRLHAHEGRLVIGLPDSVRPATLRHALHAFYLGEARADVGRWLPRHANRLPRLPSSCRIRPLVSRWGSLAPRSGALSLDLALVLAPPAAFEYVLVHELCHLLQANHSPAFWREVETRLPDWRSQRNWLREHGTRLKGELRRVLAVFSHPSRADGARSASSTPPHDPDRH